MLDLSGWRVATPTRVGLRARVQEERIGNHNNVAPRELRVPEVKALKTRGGNTRFVLADEEGNEYTTFKRVPPRSFPASRDAEPASSSTSRSATASRTSIWMT
jgi:hypothetical protein